MIQVLQGLSLVSGFVFCVCVLWACLLDSRSAEDRGATEERVDLLLTGAAFSLLISLLSLFALLSIGGLS
jgi:hypothetical protein